LTEPWPEYEQALRTTRRRVILGIGGLVGGVFTCSGLIATPFLRQGPYRACPQGLKVLDDLSYTVLEAVARQVLGEDERLGQTLALVDEDLSHLERDQQKGFTAFLTFLEGSGFVLGRSLRPFSELPADRQQQVLERWSSSSLLICRQTVRVLREQLLVHHYGAFPP